MILSKAHIRPGRVLSIEDTNGTIKAYCCGLFSDQDTVDKLPPVYQFPLAGTNSYYSVAIDDEVWVLFFDDNPLELFYIRKDNFPENLKNILENNYETVEVLASREMTSGVVQLYFTDGDGWIIRNLDAVINMRKDGTIVLDTGSSHRAIDICDNSISLGTIGGSEHPAALGDNVVKSLNILSNLLNAVSQNAKTNPYTVNISLAIDALLQSFTDSLDNIESKHITLD